MIEQKKKESTTMSEHKKTEINKDEHESSFNLGEMNPSPVFMQQQIDPSFYAQMPFMTGYSQ